MLRQGTAPLHFLQCPLPRVLQARQYEQRKERDRAFPPWKRDELYTVRRNFEPQLTVAHGTSLLHPLMASATRPKRAAMPRSKLGIVVSSCSSLHLSLIVPSTARRFYTLTSTPAPSFRTHIDPSSDVSTSACQCSVSGSDVTA